MADARDFDDIGEELRQENAAYIGVTLEEYKEMDLSEIERRIAERQREEWIEARWLGETRFRFRKWLVTRLGGDELMYRV